jgi:hypothetical protein
MTRLVIPPHIAGALTTLGGLDRAKFDQLRETLDAVDRLITRRELVEHLTQVMEHEQASDLLAALSDAMAARPEMRGTIGELVANSLELDGRPQPLVQNIADRVDVLLRSRGPAILAIKRESTVSDQPVMLDKARVATDIRPVFADTGESVEVTQEVGATIVHTLRLDVFENWRPISLYVALPEDGLALLKSVIERAEHKQQVLTRMLQSGELRLLPEDAS